jgi:hypothetical protein
MMYAAQPDNMALFLLKLVFAIVTLLSEPPISIQTPPPLLPSLSSNLECKTNTSPRTLLARRDFHRKVYVSLEVAFLNSDILQHVGDYNVTSSLPCYIVYVVFKLALIDKHGSSNAIDPQSSIILCGGDLFELTFLNQDITTIPVDPHTADIYLYLRYSEVRPSFLIPSLKVKKWQLFKTFFGKIAIFCLKVLLGKHVITEDYTVSAQGNIVSEATVP